MELKRMDAWSSSDMYNSRDAIALIIQKLLVTVESTFEFVVRKFTFPETTFFLSFLFNESESEAMARSGCMEVGYR